MNSSLLDLHAAPALAEEDGLWEFFSQRLKGLDVAGEKGESEARLRENEAPGSVQGHYYVISSGLIRSQ